MIVLYIIITSVKQWLVLLPFARHLMSHACNNVGPHRYYTWQWLRNTNWRLHIIRFLLVASPMWHAEVLMSRMSPQLNLILPNLKHEFYTIWHFIIIHVMAEWKYTTLGRSYSHHIQKHCEVYCCLCTGSLSLSASFWPFSGFMPVDKRRKLHWNEPENALRHRCTKDILL